MTETGLIVSKPSDDPVIARKRRKLELMEKNALRFRRIDLKFLAIPAKLPEGSTDSDGRPAFAILPLEDYRLGNECRFSSYSCGYQFPDGSAHFADIFSKKTDWFSTVTARPTDDVPDEVDALIEEVGGDFDRLLVAWEADWAQADGDPLLLGEIEDVWFLLAKWDTTDLESYVAGS